MPDINAPWVIDNPMSERYPVYTRGNVEEVTPDVITPLQWTAFAGPVTDDAWKKALIEFGAFEEHEFRPGMQDVQAVVHGYCYINLSVQWVFGLRMPGADPEAMSREFLGSRADAPVYTPAPGDEAPHLTERMSKRVERMFVTDPGPGLQESATVAVQFRAERPDLSQLSAPDLVARHLSAIHEYYTPVLINHFLLVYESSIATGMLNAVLAPLDDVSLGVRLMSGWGGVASAAPASALWALGRRVAGSSALTAAFDVGAENLLDRLQQESDPAAGEFLGEFQGFQYEFGSRATSEYEALPKSWETHPEIPLGLIDRLRLQPSGNDPGPRTQHLSQQRKALAAEVSERLRGPEQQAMFDTAMLAVERYMPARELSKTTMVRLLQEARLPIRELALRYVASGHLQRVEDITMLTLDEIRALIEDGAPVATVVAQRWEWWHQLQKLEPPYIINRDLPRVDQWPKKEHSAFPPASAGEVLIGIGGCPGTATGTARVVDDPAEAQDLLPGEILIAPETDPGWTPLFLSAAGVVVNAGNQLSHAAIISRELGIPCVLAVAGATKRIANGTLLTVNGAAGTVTVH